MLSPIHVTNEDLQWKIRSFWALSARERVDKNADTSQNFFIQAEKELIFYFADQYLIINGQKFVQKCHINKN